MAKTSTLASLLHIGATENAVVAARDAIIAILEQDQDSAVLVKALETLQSICSVNNTSVSGCTFSAGSAL